MMKHCSIEDEFIAVARDADAVTTVGNNLQAREKYIARWGPMRNRAAVLSAGTDTAGRVGVYYMDFLSYYFVT